MKKSVILLFAALLLFACSHVENIPTLTLQTSLEPSPLPFTPTTWPSAIPPSPTPKIIPTNAHQPTEPLEHILPADAGNFLGQLVVVILPNPSCSYKEYIAGSPTFCNDKPYPDHTFTLLVWGEDWSFLDGKCILVTGEISEYEGKYQIIATDLSQVAFC